MLCLRGQAQAPSLSHVACSSQRIKNHLGAQSGSSPANPEVHVGDSSDRGYGLMSMFAESSHVKAELRVREKWRFIVSNEAVLNPNGGGPPEVFEDVDDDVFKGSFAAAGVGARTEYGKQLQNKADGGSIFGENSSRLQRLKGPVEDSSSTLLEVHAIPEVSSRWTNPTRWKLLAPGAWRDVEEHINVKEARVALMSLRRLGRSVTNMGTTCLTLCDNLCPVLMFEKGRSGLEQLVRESSCISNWMLHRVETSPCQVRGQRC